MFPVALGFAFWPWTPVMPRLCRTRLLPFLDWLPLRVLPDGALLLRPLRLLHRIALNRGPCIR